MKHKLLSSLGGLMLTTVAITSLTACSSSNQASKESKDSSVKTESTKKTTKKETKKKAPKKNNTKKKNAQNETNSTSSSQNQQNTAQSNANTGSNQAGQQAAKSTATNQIQSTNNQTAQQATPLISNPSAAVSLVAHAMGDAAPGSFDVVSEADGYHVYLKNLANPPVTVVKPNGDLYDVNGNLVTPYATAAGPDGVNNDAW